MTPQEIHDMLKGIKLWDSAEPMMRNAFIKQMEGRQYGQGPLAQAWHWFWAGWMNFEN